MKRFTINLIISLASFALGVAAFSLVNWTGQSRVKELPPANIVVHCPTGVSDGPPPAVVPAEAPNPEVVFGGGRLRIVPDQVEMKSERLRYRIDVTYPQIAGSEDRHIRRLNERLTQLATEQWEVWLSPTKADLQYYREKWPEVFNSVDVDYEIVSATDSFLSVYFNGFSYGIGAAHAVQYSFVVNYDLRLQKEVKLSDLFKPRSKYLEFISEYCAQQLSKQQKLLFEEALSLNAKNFHSWNITREGIRFNFDECEIFSCADGEQTVAIPFADLKPMLNARALKLFTEQ